MIGDPEGSTRKGLSELNPLAPNPEQLPPWVVAHLSEVIDLATKYLIEQNYPTDQAQKKAQQVAQQHLQTFIELRIPIHL